MIYYATCSCNLIYIGLTSRELRIRTREHVRDIEAARDVDDVMSLKTIPRHQCNSGELKIRGIDHVNLGIRGGDSIQILTQKECRWIVTLDTMVPEELNEQLSFVSFL